MGGEQRAAEKDGMARIAGVFTWYSQTILIAVYTHLLLQHFEVVGGNGLAAGWVTGVPVGGHVWRWINVGATSKFCPMGSMGVRRWRGFREGQSGRTRQNSHYSAPYWILHCL